MGSLTPGATYIYERVGNTVYARESGADPSTRVVIGQDFDANDDYYKSIADKYFMEVEWSAILREARTNPALQAAVERVKILYHLSKKDE